MEVYYYLKELINRNAAQIKQIQSDLKDCPCGYLLAERTAGSVYYRQQYYEKGKRIRKVITRNSDQIQGLLRRRILSEQLANLLSEQKALESALSNISAYNAAGMFNSLVHDYPELSRDLIYGAFQNVSENEWMNEPYEQLDYRPEEKRHINSQGLRVRSKSEVMITDKLYIYKLPARYEQIIKIGEIKLAPDLTIRRADGKIFFWEHMGLMDNPEYRRRQWNKLRTYEAAGIVPWDNLIITFDNADGIIDTRIIESEIHNKLL